MKNKIILTLISAIIFASFILFAKVQKDICTRGSVLPIIKNNTDVCQNLICFVKNKLEIPKDVIKNKTIIDPVYINEESSFTGDTVYNINDDYSALIIDCSDGMVCAYKFILIINLKTNLNTDYVLGFTECDRDGDNEYYSVDFLIKNKKITIYKKCALKGMDIPDSKIIETDLYAIDDLGNLKKE